MNILYVSIVIFLLLSSCGILILTSGVRWWRKIVVFVFLASAGLISYRAMNSVRGYPVLMQEDFTDTLVLGYWADKENNTIYIWLKRPGLTDPISYRVPYSHKLHRQLENGRVASQGKPYLGNIKGKLYPLEKFEESSDDFELQVLPGFPPKGIPE